MDAASILSGLIAAAGAYGAVWAHLKHINWRIDHHDERIKNLEKA